MRILQVVGGLNRGGAETWLVQVYRAMDRSQYKFDFLVHSDGPFHYEDELRWLGARVIPCRGLKNPVLYAVNFSQILKKYGPYDCVHSHVHWFSGYVTAVAAANGVPLRMVQSHQDSKPAEQKYSIAKRCYMRIMRSLISSSANGKIAVSQAAGEALFGKSFESAGRWSHVPLGIDLEPYRSPVSRSEVRADLGLADDSITVAHVGRFDEAKNHGFLVQIATELCSIEPRVRFLLVGDGPLRPAIQDQVKLRGLDRYVRFLGVRRDVPRLLKGATDLFLFPSLYEGFPLAYVEAQLAGIPCVVSDVVSPEADVIPELVVRLQLASPAARWAQNIAALIRSKSEHLPIDRSSIETALSIEASAKHLADTYSAALARSSGNRSLISTIISA
jgi:glycosyltransferase involved in cell wall biosynthesis